MEMTDAATHLASGAGGVVSMAYIARVLIQRWVKEQDKKADITAAAIKAVTDTLGTVAVELAKIGVRMEGLQRSADASTMYGEAIAVLKSKMQNLEYDFNGLGKKVRGLANGESQ